MRFALPLARCCSRSLTVLAAALALSASLAGHALAGGSDPIEDCLWDNGASLNGAQFDGQISHIGGGHPTGTKAADDFTLCEGEVHKLRSIEVTLATNAPVGTDKAKVELYDDCNGLPGKLLHRLTVFSAEQLETLPTGDRLVRYTFVIEDQPNRADACIILRGGTYWLTAYGYADNFNHSLTYFAQSSTGVKGRPAVKAVGQTPLRPGTKDINAPWIPVDGCCLGCEDLAFKVNGESCKVLFDNGPAARGQLAGGLRSEYSPSVRDSRAADDFVVNPCEEVRVCYIEGCIFTNCPTPTVIAEIYANECKLPGERPLFRVKSSHITPLDFSYSDSHGTYQAYRVGFDLWVDDTDPIILSGANAGYWLSIAVRDNYSANERSFVCFADRCETPCDVKFNPAAQTDRMGLTPFWISGTQNRDLSFLIAADKLTPHPAPGNGSTRTCRADINHNGITDADDIFTFIDSFFQGCP